MNYVLNLLKEHSRNNTEAIAKTIGDDPEKFKKIIGIIYNENSPLPQRASWLLSVINDQHPKLLEPYLSLFVDTLKTFNLDGIKRNITNVLATHSIPKKVQGKLISICFDFILSPTETVVVKVHAMQILANLCKQYPELKNEFKAAVDDQLPKTSAAFHARARMIFTKEF